MTTAGPNFPSTAADDSSTGTITWGNTSNALTEDGSVASALNIPNGGHSHYLKLTNFGFSAIGNGDTINGIQVDWKKECLNPSSTLIFDFSVRLVIGGTITGTDKANSTGWPTTLTWVSYGGSADTWGLTSPVGSDVNGTSFGIVISARSTVGAFDAAIDAGRVTITYTSAATGVTLTLSSVAGAATVSDITLITEPHLTLASPAGVATVGNIALKAATKLALAAVSGVASVATLPLKAPAILGLGSPAGVATVAATLSTPGYLVPAAIDGTSTATATLKSAALLTLGGVQGQAATATTVSAPAPLSLATVAGTSTASANLTTPPPPVTEDDFLIRKLASLMTGRN